MSHSLFEKYNIPSPRYTSYPTVPHWHDKPTPTQWVNNLNGHLKDSCLKWALYVHIPFCKSLCHYCGCNREIKKTHDHDKNYIDALINEFKIYLKNSPDIRNHTLKTLHLGGGTPTFFSAKHLGLLIDSILEPLTIDPNDFEGSIEVDPRTTSRDQLQVLFDRGFNRVSLGVQDFNKNVQGLINREQSFEVTEKVTLTAREIGYTSVNFDLIYGLPGQGLEGIENTIEKSLLLKPDRIALYSLALVPWFSPSQRKFKDSDLPSADLKRQLYERSREMLTSSGYVDIGMDHFALPSDKLTVAKKNHSLHRNFMGYTDQNYDIMLGLGASSISESPDMYFQNLKDVKEYESKVNSQELSFFNGHQLSEEDKKIKKQILKLTTRFEVELEESQIAPVTQFLSSYIKDNLVVIDGKKLSITTPGEPFLRNICSSLDEYMQKNTPPSRQFSKSI